MRFRLLEKPILFKREEFIKRLDATIKMNDTATDSMTRETPHTTVSFDTGKGTETTGSKTAETLRDEL